jgi:membrane-bound metal-dependent hydrolase YbcI (DUF457 family)
MPTPVAHSFVGIIIYIITSNTNKGITWKRLWQHKFAILFCIIFANLPDIDFIILSSEGIQFGWDNHHGPTHSIGFVLLVMMITGIVTGIIRKDWKRWSIMSGICVLSHVLLDLIITREGLILFYPLSDIRVNIPVVFTFGYSYDMGFIGFAIMSVVQEIVIIGIVLLIIAKVYKVK